jgi:hypothetical protein
MALMLRAKIDFHVSSMIGAKNSSRQTMVDFSGRFV